MAVHSQHAFSEKVALISDGASPVGRAVAMQLALYGCYVIVGYPPASDQTVRALEELKSLGTLADAVKVDGSVISGARKLVSEVNGRYGRLDLLINCQEYRTDSSFIDISEAEFDRILDTNFKSLFFLIQESLALMDSRPKPGIVNVVSACDSAETKPKTAFRTTTAAVIGLTGALAQTLPDKYRINAVSVSENKKRMSKFDNLDEDLFDPSGGVDPDDVARTVLYLLSGEAAGINGQVLKVE